MKNIRILIALMGVVILSLTFGPTIAKAQDDGWSQPFRLSTGQGSAIEATLLADDYGYIHAFWREYLPDERSLIQYSRFDGTNWTVPNDVYVSKEFITINSITADIDQNDRLYLMWSEGDLGPTALSSAPVLDALESQNWEQPIRFPIPAQVLKLQIDSKDVFHLMYTRVSGQEAGVYYVNSKDKGFTWSEPTWLDPDILLGHSPGWLNFELDDQDNLHAAWFYLVPFLSEGDWVRYTHSFDGGRTWSSPFTIDRLDEAEKANGEELADAGPVMIVDGTTVHVIWAGGGLNYRNHRISTDSGVTWGQPTRILGELNGQAGDGYAIDGEGRIHFFSQIRFPQGIYHAIWDGEQWSTPALVYFIRMTSDDDLGDNVHAHRTFPMIRAGNQIILTFTDPPPEDDRRLFVMQKTLTDVPPSPVKPTPTPPTTPQAEPTLTPTPVSTAPAPSFVGGARPPTQPPRPDRGVWLGVAPVLLLLLGAVLFTYLRVARYR
jgi:hypothetical protein